jgi:hypothetical protein
MVTARKLGRGNREQEQGKKQGGRGQGEKIINIGFIISLISPIFLISLFSLIPPVPNTLT